jgi:uncharacterized OB-fold protein
MGASETGGKGKVFYPGENYWKEDSNGLRLIGSHCKGCGKNYFPPREICPDCYSNGKDSVLEPLTFSDGGTLYSFSIVRVAPKRFATPYGLGYVDYPEGVRVLGQITTAEPNDLKIGMKMKAEIGKIAVDEQGNEVYSYKFRPVK